MGTAYGEAVTRFVTFDCPEGHRDCWHTIPFTPTLDGTPASKTRGGAQWGRTGDTFETLTLTPSIRRVPSYKSREKAIADGCSPDNISDSLLCAFHGHITNGVITFTDDSR